LQSAQLSRRIDLGITGLADAPIMLGLHYASDGARSLAASVIRTLCRTAYRTSIDLGKKGPFPSFERNRHLKGPFIATLPDEIQRGIMDCGMGTATSLPLRRPERSVSWRKICRAA
jgi:ribonucleoside-diphosphate reductase alpha chain